MLKSVSSVLENAGFLETINKVFVLVKDMDHMPIIFFLMTMNAVSYLQYDINVNSLTRWFKDRPIDGPPFIVGLLTVFRHFHPSVFMKYLLYCSHYIKGAILINADKRTNWLPMDVALLLAVLEEIIRFGKYDREIIK